MSACIINIKTPFKDEIFKKKFSKEFRVENAFKHWIIITCN
jgi:hypothetical protein